HPSYRSTTPVESAAIYSADDGRTATNPEPIASVRLPHISARSLLEKALRYYREINQSDNLLDNVCDFTPGKDGFSVKKAADETFQGYDSGN
ncbi:4782_t:CDS:2, partial [Acaulospora colombiana]